MNSPTWNAYKPHRQSCASRIYHLSPTNHIFRPIHALYQSSNQTGNSNHIIHNWFCRTPYFKVCIHYYPHILCAHLIYPSTIPNQTYTKPLYKQLALFYYIYHWSGSWILHVYYLTFVCAWHYIVFSLLHTYPGIV